MTLFVEATSWVLILLGSFFTLVGAFGLVRMPEVFTRMHAASVTDTLGVGFLILGMCLQAGLGLVTLKLMFLLALFFFTGPVVTHALAQACLHEGIEPMLAEDRRNVTRLQADRPGRREAVIISLISAVLLTMLAVVTIAIVRQRNLFSVVILASVYSFLMASVLIVLDAVDVAMTEASVGAGISTVLLLATLHLIKTTEMRSIRTHFLAFVHFGRHRRRSCLGHTRPAPVWHAGCGDPQARGAALYRRNDQGDWCSECRDFRSGRLSRLRYSRRDNGNFHGRDRSPAVAAPGETARPRQRRGE